VQLWLQLERTSELLTARCKRFCIRRILKEWFGAQATDDFIWEVCEMGTLTSPDDKPFYGQDLLPPPTARPREHRELLRAIVAVCLNIGCRKVKLKELDAAYSIAFPHRTPLNVNKKVTKKLNKK